MKATYPLKTLWRPAPMRRLGQEQSLTADQYRAHAGEAISRRHDLIEAVNALPPTDSFTITEMFKQPLSFHDARRYGDILGDDAKDLQEALEDLAGQYEEPVSSKAMWTLTHLEERLDELEAVINETAPKEEPPAPFPIVPVLWGAVGTFALAEVIGITNILGFRG